MSDTYLAHVYRLLQSIESKKNKQKIGAFRQHYGFSSAVEVDSTGLAENSRFFLFF